MAFKMYKKSKKKLFFKLLCIGLIIAVSGLLLDAMLRPYASRYAKSRAIDKCVTTVNEAIVDVLTASGYTYDEICYIERTKDGVVTTVRTDVMVVNRIKSLLALEITNRVKSISVDGIKVPLGNIFGLYVLNGRGPDLNVKMSLTGSVEINIESIFDEAGVNQTRHRVMMKIEMTLNVLALGIREPVIFSDEVCIAETIIVGYVPNVVR
jgi:sporulation protein YunB